MLLLGYLISLVQTEWIFDFFIFLHISQYEHDRRADAAALTSFANSLQYAAI